MNIKEAFRYQAFLDRMMRTAASNMMNPKYTIKVTKTHKRSEASPDASDMVEDVDAGAAGRAFSIDDVVMFAVSLTNEREVLSEAINRAKCAAPIDIDAVLAANKFRWRFIEAARQMLAYKPSIIHERGIGYKLNVEGSQVQYVYDVEVAGTENFNRPASKETLKFIISRFDDRSAAIESAMINTEVNYTPPYDINDEFDEVMDTFVNERK